jgi:hypothetical protein
MESFRLKLVKNSHLVDETDAKERNDARESDV